MDKRPIGVYDSGMGGLTVLNVLRKVLPHEDFIYFADTINLPYGNKSPQQVINYSRNIINWYQNEMKAKVVISACHTSSALALEIINEEFQIPLIGTIRPLLPYILHDVSCRRIGVIATLASATSRAHETIFKMNGFTGDVISIPCPDFVPLIEAGKEGSQLIKDRAAEYLSVFKQENFDALLYGCTHYPLIKGIVEGLLPPGVKCIDPAEYIAKDVTAVLSENQGRNNMKGSVTFYASSDPQDFLCKIKRVTDISSPSVTQVVL